MTDDSGWRGVDAMIDDKRTTDARLLDESIAHWDRLLALYLAGDRVGLFKEGYRTPSCSLCDAYLDEDEECHGCPVYTQTGQHLCKGSPWQAAAGAIVDLNTSDAPTDEGAAAIRAQGDYLRRLRAELEDVT